LHQCAPDWEECAKKECEQSRRHSRKNQREILKCGPSFIHPNRLAAKSWCRLFSRPGSSNEFHQ
jgi:hypothetical protein